MPIIVHRQQSGPTPGPAKTQPQPAVWVGDTIYAVVYTALAGALAAGSLGWAFWVRDRSLLNVAQKGTLDVPFAFGHSILLTLGATIAVVMFAPKMLRGDSSAFSDAGAWCWVPLVVPLEIYMLFGYQGVVVSCIALVLGIPALHRGAKGRW